MQNRSGADQERPGSRAVPHGRPALLVKPSAGDESRYGFELCLAERDR